MVIQIQIRRGTAAQWTAANPVLASGEIGFETDLKRIKIGDGVTAWAALAYFSSGAGGIHGNEMHTSVFVTDADIIAAVSAHSALSTGVHGVGAGTVAKVTDIAVDANLSAAAQKAVTHYTKAISTGIITRGVISINGGDNTRVDITAGTSLYVDDSDPLNPVIDILSWGAQTLLPPALDTANRLWIGISRSAPGAGAIVFSQEFTPSEKRTIAVLGRVWSNGSTTIEGVGQYATPSWGIGKTLEDLMVTLGSMNRTGNVFSAHGGDLLLNKSAGTSFRFAAGSGTDMNSPNVHTDAALTALAEYHYHVCQDGTGVTSLEVDIDPDNYDNAGVKTAVPAGKFTLQRVYYFPKSGVVDIGYGQAVYDTMDEALLSVNAEIFTISEQHRLTLYGSILRAWVIVKQGAGDLAVLVDARIITPSSITGNTSTTLAESQKLFTNVLSTGILMGGTLSINGGDQSLFDITAGAGVVVDNYTNPLAPTKTLVTWGAQTGLSTPYLATDSWSTVMINSGGVISFTNIWPGPADRRDYIVIGWVDHVDNVLIDFAYTEPYYNCDIQSQISDAIEAGFPIFNVNGNVFSANAGLTITKNAGELFDWNSNYVNSKKNPHILSVGTVAPVTFVYYYRDGGTGWVNDGTPTTAIDPDNYDDDSGTLAAVPAGKWTIQVIGFYPIMDAYDIQYGQTYYDTAVAALAAVNNTIEINPYNSSDQFRCWLIVQKGATDLTDPAQALFVEIPKFGLGLGNASLGGGGGGIAVNIGGNTAGTPAVISSGTVSFMGGNNITLSQNGQSVTISGPNAGGAQTGISGIAGSAASTVTQGTVQFGNLNGFSFGLNGSTMTASGEFRFTSADSLLRQVSADSQLQFTSANSNLLGTGATQSFRHTSADSQLRFTSADTQIMKGWSLVGAQTAGTTTRSNLSSLHLSAGAMLTLSGNNDTVVISFNSGSVLGTGATQSFRHTSADSQLQFTSANSNLLGTGATASFRHTSADSQLQFTSANSNLLGTGATASFRHTSADSQLRFTSADTALAFKSAGVVSAVSLSGNNTAGVMAIISTGTVYFAGGNNITLSQNGQSVTISAGGGGAGDGYNPAQFTNSTANTTMPIVWAGNSGGSGNITLGLTGSTVTGSAPGGGGGGGTARIFQPQEAQALVTHALMQGSVFVNPIAIPFNMTATNLDLFLMISNSSSAGGTLSVNIGLYTYTQSTANTVSSTLFTFGYNSTLGGLSSYTNISGTRYHSCSLGNWAITPGDYLLAVGISVGTGLTSGSYSYYGGSSISVVGAAYLGAGNLSRNWGFPGVFSAATNAVRASFHISDINRTGNTAWRQPWVAFKGTF
jgi:hypothetical protein